MALFSASRFAVAASPRVTHRRGVRILLTNDDGVNARGLKLLESVARRFSDDIWIVAPTEEQSGAGHSLTLTTPVRLRRHDERRFSVTGPAIQHVPVAGGVQPGSGQDEVDLDLETIRGIAPGAQVLDYEADQANATSADSEPEMPAIEYRIRPSDAATSTMQMAMNIVEIRIICRATLPSATNPSTNVDSRC